MGDISAIRAPVVILRCLRLRPLQLCLSYPYRRHHRRKASCCRPSSCSRPHLRVLEEIAKRRRARLGRRIRETRSSRYSSVRLKKQRVLRRIYPHLSLRLDVPRRPERVRRRCYSLVSLVDLRRALALDVRRRRLLLRRLRATRIRCPGATRWAISRFRAGSRRRRSGLSRT